MSDTPEANHALLFTSAHCPHCPTVKKILTQLNQSGELDSLEVYDVAGDHELAEKYGVRSVPWFRIGSLEFQGLHSAGELAYWAEKANSKEGILRYITEQLKEGKLGRVEDLIQQHPAWLSIALGIIEDTAAPLQARIGLGAMLEGLAGSSLLQSIYPQLEKLTSHTDHRVRGDACHYLGLITTEASKTTLQHCLADEHPEVREIAQDSLDNFQT